MKFVVKTGKFGFRPNGDGQLKRFAPGDIVDLTIDQAAKLKPIILVPCSADGSPLEDGVHEARNIILDMNADQAKAYIGATPVAELDALEAAEKLHDKFEGGRKAVLDAIDKRRKG